MAIDQSTADLTGAGMVKTGAAQGVGPSSAAGTGPALGTMSSGEYSDPQLLTMWARWKKESFDQRWIFERQWMRDVWYILNRQWIYYDAKRGQWQDKRLAKWVPRPVTNILKEGVQSVRANFASINYGANARPVGDDNKNVVTAGVADDYAPILHELHKMNKVMSEADFWMLVTGNTWLHTGVNYDRQNGITEIQHETCVKCGQTYSEIEIADAGQKCPHCGSTAFMPAVNPDGSPMKDLVALPKGITVPLSPFEIAFPLMYDNFDDVPYAIRMRWRDKSYYEQNEEMQAYSKTLQFSKMPHERTMQIFKSLPFQSDLGLAPPFFASGDVP